jgi:hypothetical protein
MLLAPDIYYENISYDKSNDTYLMKQLFINLMILI